MRENNRFVILEKWVVYLVLFLVLLISNRMTWLCVLEVDMPLFGCWYGSRTNELFLYIMALVLVILGLILNNRVKQKYNAFWQQNKWLFLFLFFCVISLIWTIDWIRTVYKSLLVIVSALVAVYLGVRYRDTDWLKILIVFSLIAISLSYLLVLFLPGAAIMSTPWHAGSWRGAFSHRNYMGAIIAYGNACILLMFFVQRKIRSRILLSIFYVLSWGLLAMSRSATGVILVVILNFVLLGYLAYLKWGHILRSQHYTIIVGSFIIAALLLILNLDRILGLLGRSSSLTGRVPLWMYLFGKVSNHNLWFGYGFGTIWDYLQFRVEAARTLGWPFEVVNSHNGFVDVFVYLGLVGLGLFLALIVQVVYRTFSYLAKERTIASAWVLITLVYVLVSNITISFFFDFETFHWVLLIVILALSSRPSMIKGKIIEQA